MKISQLVTFGDSYTFGEELNDPQYNYPNLLAKHFNCPLINTARPGYSNDAISEKVLEQPTLNDSFFIISFSFYTRLYFEDEDGWFTTIQGSNQNLRNKITNLLLMKLSDEWLYKRWLCQMIYLQHYLNANNIKYIFSLAHCSFRYDLYQSKFDNLYKKIDFTKFLGWPTETFDTITEGLPRGKFGHPLEQAHKKYAEFLITQINQIYNF